MLSQLDDLTRQAKELSETIKRKMAGQRSEHHIAADWTDRRHEPERRKKRRA